MKKQNIQWCVNLIQTWMDENPSLNWDSVWESLAEVLEVKDILQADKIKIKQALSASDYY